MSWEMVGLLMSVAMAWSGLLVAAVKWLLDRNQAHIDRRFQALEDAHKTEAAQWHRVERDLLKLRGDLPNEYVRREDWIRFGGTVEAKLDGLANKIDSVKDRLHA